MWFPDSLSEGVGLLGALLKGLLGVKLFFCFQTLALCAKVDSSVSAMLSRPEISQHEAQAPPAMNLHLSVTQHCTFPAQAPHEGQQRLAVQMDRHQDISALFVFLVLGWHYSSSDCSNVTMSNLQCLPFKKCLCINLTIFNMLNFYSTFKSDFSFLITVQTFWIVKISPEHLKACLELRGAS